MIVLMLFCILGGLAVCLIGYRIYRLFCGFSGLLLGALAGALLSSAVLNGGWALLLIPLTGAAAAILSVISTKAGTAVAGGGCGAILLYLLSYAVWRPLPLLSLAGGAASAVLAVLFFPKFRFIGTAAGGALTCISALFVLLTPLRDTALWNAGPLMQREAVGLLLVSIAMAALAGGGLQHALYQRSQKGAYISRESESKSSSVKINGRA